MIAEHRKLLLVLVDTYIDAMAEGSNEAEYLLACDVRETLRSRSEPLTVAGILRALPIDEEAQHRVDAMLNEASRNSPPKQRKRCPACGR